MSDIHSTDSWQVLIAVTWPFVQQFLKNWKAFPLLSKDGMALRNHVVSFLVALAATLGLHYSWAGSAVMGWTFTLVIPSASVLQHVAGQWLAQHIVYRGAVQLPEKASRAVELLEQIAAVNAENTSKAGV